MVLEPYIYNLPADRIAQRPVYPYDSAKMLVVNKDTAVMQETAFNQLANFLRPGDRLVFNNTAVIPARIFGQFASSAGRCELLLVEKTAPACWWCLGKPLKKFKPGLEINFSTSAVARVVEKNNERVLLEFYDNRQNKLDDQSLYQLGCMPIPPYIRKGRSDKLDQQDYQTIFAASPGSIAAPTASLHFTNSLIESLKDYAIDFSWLTLHLGVASFLPLWQAGDVYDLTLQKPGSENLVFDATVLNEISKTKQQGGRVIAVGTSVVRSLETLARLDMPKLTNNIQISTDLFIQPGFDFKVVDAIITNFHQPRTTHLLLVEAFLGKQLLAKSYDYALANNFRFLSYGDGMLLLLR